MSKVGYNPAYIHEQALGNSVKKLHMLGSKAPRKASGPADIGDAIGSASASLIAKQAVENLRRKQAVEARQKEALAVRDAQVEGQERWQETVEKYGDHHANVFGQSMNNFMGMPTPDQDGMVEAEDWPTEVSDRIKAGQLAEETRMGGKYTPGGLEMIDKNSTLNAQDRLRAQALIGIGGSVRRF